MSLSDDSSAGFDGLQEAAAKASKGYKTVSEVAYEAIKESILTGLFVPGQRLRQEALADAIGVSRIPIRSALMQLEIEGLVSYHQRRGAVVTSLTVAEVREIYELRELLESHALRRTAGTLSKERVKRLRALADDLDKHVEGPGFVDARVEFYRELYNADSNPRLIELIESLRASVGRYLLGVRVSSGKHAGHRALVDALANGDVDKALAWLHDHLATVSKGVEELAEAHAAAVPTEKRRQPRFTGLDNVGGNRRS
jgi:DNA-binding GntR family transcriptional regulator